MEPASYKFASEALGIEWHEGTPAHVIGRRLVLLLNMKRGWYHFPPAKYEDLLQSPLTRGDGLNTAWRRLPTPAEIELGEAHAYDKSAAYLSVCSSLDLPYGEPSFDGDIWPHKEPGKGWRAALWNVRISHADSAWDGRELPEICPAGQAWIWTPTLRAALDAGYQIELCKGAIIWPEQHRVLETWQQKVWSARRFLEMAYREDDYAHMLEPEAPSAVEDAIALVKQVYTQTIGMFGHSLDPHTYSEDEIEAGAKRPIPRWYRPEWQRLIHAELAARVFYTVQKGYNQLDLAPLWTRADTIAYPASEDPTTLAIRLGLRQGANVCGGWRYQYSLPVTALLGKFGADVIGSDGKKHKLPAVAFRG